MAPVLEEQKKHPEEILPVICVTAQHRKMLDQVLDLFSIEPDYDLNIMEHDQSLFGVTSSVLCALEDVLLDINPDIVLVQGDTTTTFVASLAAFYTKIPVGHIEGGLRTRNKQHPFPEEINRRLVSHIADLHFAATDTARWNLISEGVEPGRIFVTGNPVVDALLSIVEDPGYSGQKAEFEERLSKELGFVSPDTHRRIITVTAHRRESFGLGIENICLALKDIALRNQSVEIVYPVHFNPNIREKVLDVIGGIRNIHLTEPLDYTSCVMLMDISYLILTDSGGIQEEAPSLGKPVLVMREATERIEGLEAGITRLVGTRMQQIASETQLLLDNQRVHSKMANAVNPYGDGKAAERIIRVILDRLAKP